MFRNCLNFNAPVDFGNGFRDITATFTNCISYEQPIIIPNSTTSVGELCLGAVKVTDIYFKRDVYTSINVKSLYANTLNSLQKNIHFNSVLNNVFNKTMSYESVIGKAITWTDMEDGNGFYNTTYNIYCYNNYEV